MVDDDVRMRDLLQRYLGEQGFNVRVASDAIEMDAALAQEHDTHSRAVQEGLLFTQGALQGGVRGHSGALRGRSAEQRIHKTRTGGWARRPQKSVPKCSSGSLQAV